MEKEFESVIEFHYAFDHHTPDRPTLDGYPYRLRAKLVVSEAIEFAEACGLKVYVTAPNGERLDVDSQNFGLREAEAADWEKMIDALCDGLVVHFGSFVSMGIRAYGAAAFFAEVMHANMAKRGGGKDRDGKSLKPKGWQPPQIRALLQRILQASAIDRGEPILPGGAR